jgi:hypothetical protein
MPDNAIMLLATIPAANGLAVHRITAGVSGGKTGLKQKLIMMCYNNSSYNII